MINEGELYITDGGVRTPTTMGIGVFVLGVLLLPFLISDMGGVLQWGGGVDIGMIIGLFFGMFIGLLLGIIIGEVIGVNCYWIGLWFIGLFLGGTVSEIFTVTVTILFLTIYGTDPGYLFPMIFPVLILSIVIMVIIAIAGVLIRLVKLKVTDWVIGLSIGSAIGGGFFWLSLLTVNY